MLIQDLHSHTYYSNCGRDDPELVVRAAVNGGVKQLGICDHNYGIGERKPQYFEEMKALLDYACETFEYRQVFFKDQTFSQYPVTNGCNAVVTTPASEAYAILPIELTPEDLRWVYPDSVGAVAAPVQAGQKIASVEVWYGELCIAQTDLLAMNDVDVYVPQTEPDMPSYLQEERAGKLIAIIAGALLGIIVLVFLSLVVIRYFRIAAMQAKRRRRRANRRRNY